MPARDYYHNVVKKAIQKDGWTITNDPFFTFNISQAEIVTWIL